MQRAARIAAQLENGANRRDAVSATEAAGGGGGSGSGGGGGAGASLKHGGDVTARALVEQGVSVLFCLTGGHVSPILVGAHQAGIRVVDVRDEVTAVFAADAVARLSGIPGVAVVTAGPGLTNTITAVKNAQMAQSPVVVLGGATSMLLKGRGSLQDIDQLALLRPHTKLMISIRAVREIVPAIRKAFRVSQEGVPGPVFIEYPLDVIWPRDMLEEILGLSKAAATTAGAKEKGKEQGADEKQGKSDAQGAKEGQSPRGKAPKSGAAAIRGRVMERVQQLYLQHHIHRVFDRAFEIPPPSLLSKPTVLFASQQAVAAVAARLSSSSRPLVLVGSQAVFRSAQVGALVKALERLQAPCFLSGMARGLLGEAHRLQMRHKRSSALARADFVLLLGVPMDFRLDYGRHVGKGAFLALVNLDSVTLRKNSDIRAVDARVLADPLNFAVQLAERATAAPPPAAWGEWAKALEALQAKREREIDAMALAESKQPGARFVSPLRLCREIDAALDANSVVVADGGDFVGTASYIVRPRSPLSWLDPGVFGTLGVGGGFAMGAHAVRPQAEVWVLFGDGSVGWSLSEFDTYVRHKIPVIAVVGNDACWSQMYRDQVRLLKDPVATELAQTRYDEVVRGFGAEGILVRSEDEVAPALQRAKALAKQGRPVLVNVFINRSQFREGSISL